MLDLANLIDALGPEPVTLVGHSLGGSVTVMYAGIYPERVRKLVSIEGLGPPPAMIERMRARPPHERVRDWIEQMRDLAGAPAAPLPEPRGGREAHARGELLPVARSRRCTSPCTA